MTDGFTEYSRLNAVAIVQLCLDAGAPERIIPFLLDYVSADEVRRELGAATGGTLRHGAANSARQAGDIPEQLEAAAAARFRQHGGEGP